MFSVRQKREIANKIQLILRETNHPELPQGEIQFLLHVEGSSPTSWADIKNNGAVSNPSVNPWNEAQDYQNMDYKLNIQSIFDSIDGEMNGFGGAGELSTFVRLKGCQLQCNYCDTKYSQSSEPENWMFIDEIIQQIHFPKVTITGGEPLLQKKGVEELCSGLVYGKSCFISVETNGTIQPTFFLDRIRYVVDFKLPSSGMIKHMKSIVFASLRAIDVIKFVISDEEDYKYAKMLIQEHPSWIAKKVMSPTVNFEGYSFEELSEEGIPSTIMDWPRQLAEMMIKDKVDAQLSLQLHKILWPGTKEER